MTLEYVIRILTNKLTRLRDSRISAEANGDIDLVASLDAEIAETEITLHQLQSIV
jgi:hypothetical protein